MKNYAIIKITDCFEDYILNSFSYEEVTDEFILENDDLFLDESNIEKSFDTLEEAKSELEKDYYKTTYTANNSVFYCEMFAIMKIEYDSAQNEYVIGNEFYGSSKPSLKLKKYFMNRDLKGENKPLWYIDETMIEYDFMPEFDPEDIDQLEKLIYRENSGNNRVEIAFQITSTDYDELDDCICVEIKEII